MEYPWSFYEKSVGMWVVESGRSVYSFPLKTEGLDLESVAREYFHFFDEATLALNDFFTATAIEYPPGAVVMESPRPLDLRLAKERLFTVWTEDIGHCDIWAPGAILRGLTEVAVQSDGSIIRTQLPGVISIMFSAVPGSDRYALALATNCDIWLEKTISGKDNAVGRANALKLQYALEKLVNRLDWKVVHYATEFEGIAINEYGFGVK